MWRSLFRPDGFLRQEMLTIYLILVSVTTFLGYLFTPMQAVSQANLVVSVLAVCLFAVVRIRAIFSHLVHAVAQAHDHQQRRSAGLGNAVAGQGGMTDAPPVAGSNYQATADLQAQEIKGHEENQVYS